MPYLSRRGFIARAVLLLSLCTPAVVAAQAAVIVYADDLIEVEITGFDGEELYIGIEIPAGSRIQTANSTLELEIEPTGNIVYLDENTTFSIDQISVEAGSVSQSFTLTQGVVRSVVALLEGDSYQVRTPSAALGVRGTDFLQEVVPGESDVIIVNEGEVEVTRQTDNEVQRVPAGSRLDARGPDFRPTPLDSERLTEVFDSARFRGRDPREVPDRREYGPGGNQEGRPRPAPGTSESERLRGPGDGGTNPAGRGSEPTTRQPSGGDARQPGDAVAPGTRQAPGDRAGPDAQRR